MQFGTPTYNATTTIERPIRELDALDALPPHAQVASLIFTLLSAIATGADINQSVAQCAALIGRITSGSLEASAFDSAVRSLESDRAGRATLYTGIDSEVHIE